MSNTQNDIITENNQERLEELKSYEQTLLHFGERRNPLLDDCREQIRIIELANYQLTN